MTNFDVFLNEKEFESFAQFAVTAENCYSTNTTACVDNCGRALDIAVRWMYSVDSDLKISDNDALVSLVCNDSFRTLIGDDLWRRINYIRQIAKTVVQKRNKFSPEQAALCLENLFDFLDFISFCYGNSYEEKEFDRQLLNNHSKSLPTSKGNISSLDSQHFEFSKIISSKSEEMTKRRQVRKSSYKPKVLSISEYRTRKLYIDTELTDIGWVEGDNWINEYEISGMPNDSKTGYIDYALLRDSGEILAIIEAKKTSVNISRGRHQAKLYADAVEKKQSFRPIVFLSNGFETHIIDNEFQERKVATFYSKSDLEKLFNLRKKRGHLASGNIDRNIVDRLYQIEAIKAVCESFEDQKRRKALIVMATGAGKTRTIIALCKLLVQEGWVKNILFLADRNALVTQAHRNFTRFLGDLNPTNLCKHKDTEVYSRCIVSTYQTIFRYIDSARDDKGKLFTCGHFDLIVCDEAHRSIYNKYHDIFTYFDSHLIGLTATPKDDIDRNTYDVFDLEDRIPTFAYDLAQAVKDRYLVDYKSIITGLRFVEQGIVYDELSDDDKSIYENTFEDENGNVPPSIDPGALNNWVFNEDTIEKVLETVMEKGLKIEYGTKIGKTIIFATNHKHAEKILEVFNKKYPKLNGHAAVISCDMSYAQDLLDDFSNPEKLPQIAISVDMLDTGIDIPEILNLVFFKKVFSKSKFWQMIGRGTRLCKYLIDGADKEHFLIFDFCGNFEFFNLNPNGTHNIEQLSLQGRLFYLKALIAYKLQDFDYQQVPELVEFRKSLVDYLIMKVANLDRTSFQVKQHLKFVDMFSEPEKYQALCYGDIQLLESEIAPLVELDDDDPKAMRFDVLMHGIEQAYLVHKPYTKEKRDLKNKVSALAKVMTIPEVKKHEEIIGNILHTNYLDSAGINEFEHIRESLRELIKFLPVEYRIYETDFEDVITHQEIQEANIDDDTFIEYKERAKQYLLKHQDNPVVEKIKKNVPLSTKDIPELEKILWNEVGTQEEYNSENGSKGLGEFVREIVGLDIKAAKEAFAEFLDESNYNSKQIYIVNQIIEYITEKGLMKDLSVLQYPPFIEQGSVSSIFTDPSVWDNIKKVIDQINSNVMVA